MIFAASATLSATTNNPWSCHRFDETFKLNRPGGFGRRGLYLLFTKALRPPSPSSPLQVSGNASTYIYIYNQHIRLWNTCDNTPSPISPIRVSRPLISLPSRLSLFTGTTDGGFGVGLPVKSAVRSIDRATPKIVECRLTPDRIQRVK